MDFGVKYRRRWLREDVEILKNDCGDSKSSIIIQVRKDFLPYQLIDKTLGINVASRPCDIFRKLRESRPGGNIVAATYGTLWTKQRASFLYLTFTA